MLWLAGLLGLVTVGSVAILDLSQDDQDEADNQAADASDEAADGTVTPADELLPTGDDDSSDETPGSAGSPTLPTPAVPEAQLEITDFLPGQLDFDLTSHLDFEWDLQEGSDGADTLVGTGEGEEISAGTGNDQAHGYGGDDSIDGGEGRDVLHGGEGNDTLLGTAGDDLLHGEEGSDVLSGGDDEDTLFGHFGADTLLGGEGNDSAHGGQDDDLLMGGSGADALHGNDDDDTLTGGSGEDTLFGGTGNDFIWGAEEEAEQDYLNGGEGDDTLFAGEGDVVTAGDGADQIWFEDQGENGQAVELVDFNSAEDHLVVFWSPESEAEPEITIEDSADNNGEQIVRVNGEEVLRLSGAEDLSSDDFTLVDRQTADLAGLLAA